MLLIYDILISICQLYLLLDVKKRDATLSLFSGFFLMHFDNHLDAGYGFKANPFGSIVHMVNHQLSNSCTYKPLRWA